MKKLLTALVVALLLWALPTVVLAEASGTCGDNLTWTFTDDGVLSISGEGEMYNYTTANAPGFPPTSPWYAYESDITSVVIGNGVTSIGNMAFSSCTHLVSVKIPDSVTSIGGSAFNSCTSLASITVPDSVATIGRIAFFNCSALSTF